MATVKLSGGEVCLESGVVQCCPEGVEPVDCIELPQFLDIVVETADADCSCLDGRSFQLDHGGSGGGPWSGTDAPPATCAGDVNPSWQINFTLTCSTEPTPGELAGQMDISQFGTTDCAAGNGGSGVVSPTVVVASPLLIIFDMTLNGVDFTVTITEP